MPKIDLKPNSPEFADSDKGIGRKPLSRCCDMPECAAAGEFRAPKDRSLSHYYWFCYEHVQDYNKAWNYFAGMSMAEVEDYINTASVWDRPTRRYDAAGKSDELLRKAQQTYHFMDEEPPKARAVPPSSRQTPEFEALALLGLEAPITLDDIKTRYKILAKKYHPDHNREDPEAEELLKKINMAYTILKMAYQKYEVLEE
ncbi:MAG: DnaJ domain-containing protein [Pseudobdellovibrionaceae bacterium]